MSTTRTIRVLGIAASPRRDGNSTALLRAALGGAEAAGDGLAGLDDGFDEVEGQADRADALGVEAEVPASA